MLIRDVHAPMVKDWSREEAKSFAVPRRRSEIPEVRNCEEQDPKQEERCFRLEYRFEIGPELTWRGQECEEQKHHAEQPADDLPIGTDQTVGLFFVYARLYWRPVTERSNEDCSLLYA